MYPVPVPIGQVIFLLVTIHQTCASVCQPPATLNSVKAGCDPKPLLYRHEGCKECVYADTEGIKTIAIGFNLQEPGARAIMSSVGADYDTFINGPVTPVKTPCNCTKVPCLNEEQITKIFDITVQTAIKDAQSSVSTFSSLCCTVQNAVVDMSFTLGGPTLSTFKEFIFWLNNQNWKASADDLRTTKWCQIQAKNRCSADADTFQQGCGCTGITTRNCDAQSSSCCQETQTCCKGTLTFKNYITRTETELLCCPYSNAACCEKNKCCQSQYPICCLPDLCCAPGNKCISGQCYRGDGTRGESTLNTCSKPQVLHVY